MKRGNLRRCAPVLTLALFLTAVLGLSSCSYRAAGVKPLGEPVRVVVSVNQGRLVRVQGYLQDEVAAAIERKLGWQVSPSGSAKVELHIDEEVISARGHDTRGIANRWTISCRGQTLFTSRQGSANSTWTGTGYSGGLEDEATALQQAARNAAELVAVWLENQAEHWPVAPE